MSVKEATVRLKNMEWMSVYFKFMLGFAAKIASKVEK